MNFYVKMDSRTLQISLGNFYAKTCLCGACKAHTVSHVVYREVSFGYSSSNGFTQQILCNQNQEILEKKIVENLILLNDKDK